MKTTLLISLIEKYTHGSISSADLEILREWFYDTSPEEFQRILELCDIPAEYKNLSLASQEFSQSLELKLNELAKEDIIHPALQPLTGELQSADASPSLRRTHILNTTWFKYAAAIIVLITGIALYYHFSRTAITSNGDHSEYNQIVKADVPPGFNRAVLTLSNGQQVELDSAATGTIKDGSLFIENHKGQLIYQNTGVVAMNTMTTPNGGQYQLTLADGTRVWLNAASSITYPTAFTEKTREVTITGEAYFEVAKNPNMPFRVNVNDQAKVEVLGTHFNVKAYENEERITATLLEGSVKISKTGISVPSVTLKPLQQAHITEVIKLNNDVSIEQVTAWKNGLFSFKKADLKTVMRELARWYGVEVTYAGNIPDRVFTGEIGRGLTFRQVLDGLSQSRIKYIIENNNRIKIIPDEN